MKAKIFIVFAVLIGFGCTTDREESTPYLNYVPKNATIIIQINDLAAFKEELSTNVFLTQLKETKTYRSVFDKIKNLQYLEDKTTGIIAFTEVGKENYEFTFVTEEKAGIFNLDSTPNKKVEQLTYETYDLITYHLGSNDMFSTSIEGKMIVSSSITLLERLIDNVGEIANRPILQRLLKIANTTKPANIIIDIENVKGLADHILKNDSEVSIYHFSDWMAMDFGSSNDQLQFTGLTIANDSIKNYVNLFKNTRPLTNTVASFAPFDTDAILSYTFDDYRVFSKNQQKYLNRETVKDSLFNTVEEIGIIWSNNQKSILLQTYGSENILEYLSGFKKKSYAYQGNEILEFNATNFLSEYLDPIIEDFQPNYGTILENAFVFSKDKEAVQYIITSYKNGATFDKTSLFTAAKEGLASESTMLYVSNAQGVEANLKREFSDNFYQDLKKAELSKFVFSMQLIADDNFFHSNSVIQKIEKEARTQRVSPMFNIELDADLANDPQFVTNHITRRKEIVVQDMANTLYLISRQGKILWKKQLDGKIQGKIHQVDIYKNGRLQLAFTTNNQFLILDRNGKNVKPFTLSYEGGNLNPLAVFDYEGKKEYRFVVTQGEKVFMYNSKGKIVKGFKYTRAESAILRAPKHIVIGKKDHLVFPLEDGTLKILNRVGDVRVRVADKIKFSKNEIFRYKNKFTITDKKGVLHQIDTRGKVVRTNFNLNEDHGLDATSNTLVYMNDNILSIKGKKVELDLGVYTAPTIFYIYDKIYVAVTDIQNQQVYLFDSQAKSIANFPVFGTSRMDLSDMDNDRKIELVVRDQQNSLVVYEIK